MPTRPHLARLSPAIGLLAWSLAVATLAGGAVTLFRLIMGGLGTWRNAAGLGPEAWWQWLVLPIVGFFGGAIAGWLGGRVVPDAAGGGIPDVVKALADGGSGPRLRLRAIVAKFAGGAIGIGAGLSLGREGPSIHIGAGIGDVLHRFAGPDARGPLILAGVAGAMAAAFNTPLAATVFVVEGLRREPRGETLAAVAAAAVAGDALARAAAGHFVAFPFVPIEPALSELPAYLLLGAACGLLGHLYKRSLLAARGASSHLAGRLPRAWHPALVGLGTGVVGIFVPDAMGGGLNLVTASLYAGLALGALPLVFLAKLATTAAAYGSGAPGGYFGPALVLGAVAGLGVGEGLVAIAPGWGFRPSTFAQAGMGAFVAAALHVPLTAIVLTIELTGQLGGLLPMMAAVVVAYGVAAALEPRSLTDLLSAPA
jgi:CIC family chloride channel protein